MTSITLKEQVLKAREEAIKKDKEFRKRCTATF